MKKNGIKNELVAKGESAVEILSPATSIREAIAGGADLEKLGKLLELQERWAVRQFA